MARKTKAAPPADDEIEELDDEVEEVEEVEDDEVSDDSEGEGLTAKALAKLLGSNGREVRKFLRSERGKVGQGQRWNIDPDDVEELKTKFANWGKRSKGEGKKPKKSAPPADEAVDEVEELENDELEDISDIEDLDDLELDD